MSTTPLGAAPAAVQRQALVAQAMGALTGVEELPLDEQVSLLTQAQELLSGVLNGTEVSQLRLPGVG